MTSESLGEIEFWLDAENQENSVVGVFSRIVHRNQNPVEIPETLYSSAVVNEEEIIIKQVSENLNEMSLQPGDVQVEDLKDEVVSQLETEPEIEDVPKESVFEEKIIVPMIPGPVKEQRKAQKRSVRILNSTGLMVETLRMFEAIRQAEEEYCSSSSSGEEEEEVKESKKKDLPAGEETNEKPIEEKIHKRPIEVDTSSTSTAESLQKRRPRQGVINRVQNFLNLTGCSYDASSGSEFDFENADVYYLKKNIKAQNNALKIHPATVNLDPFKPVEMSVFDSSTNEETREVPEKLEKKKRNLKHSRKILPEEVQSAHMHKYWAKRYQLFSRFDEGIRLDEESWFSVTPEEIAKHIAERCQSDVIVDGFCGAGGNSIQFALTCERVIAIDIDPEKIKLAAHNAQVYGVLDRIEFICGDFFKIAPLLKADVIFLSPPWGGPNYLNKKVFNLEDLSCMDGKDLYKTARRVSENVVMYLPRNTNTQQMLSLAGPGSYVEIEQSVLRKKVVAITVYFGELVNASE
ncbi:uncharacterized protein LOC132200254 [Neocloeon triangulifer]|uniref:uncharacterized protein LOC132200254 n=1 Tax=Neocloeon triangulifer TaxID=2078957 RepID=UPI00286F8ED0|nr:uncharacterized protein LOC132200254 [Neocloeon triangulifer]